MEFPVYFPNTKKGSTKDSIIRILTEENSLTNQKIFNRLKKKYSIHRSYQTVRQALLELVDSGVLEKNGRDYSISAEWIKMMDNYVGLLKKKYIDNKEIKIIDENTKEIEINSLFDLGHFTLHSFKSHFFDMNQEDELYMYVQHLWVPFGDWKKRNMLKNFFSKTKSIVFVRNSSFGDRILSGFYRKYCKVKFNIKLDDFFDFIIQGDCIAKIYMPKELRKRMDKAYSFRKLSFSLIDEVTELTYTEYPIKIIITRNKEMVDEIKSQLSL